MTDSLQDISSALLLFLNSPRKRYTIDDYMEALREMGFHDDSVNTTVRQLKRQGLVEETGDDGYYLELTGKGAQFASTLSTKPESPMSADGEAIVTDLRARISPYQQSLQDLKQQKIDSDVDLENVEKLLLKILKECSASIEASPPLDVARILSRMVWKENRFRIPGVHPLDHRRRQLQVRIDERIATLAEVVLLADISDPLVLERSLADERVNLTVDEKASLLLEKLYALRKIDGYWPGNLVFQLNQVTLDSPYETQEILKLLESHGLVKISPTSEGLGGRLTAAGKDLVQKNMKSTQAERTGSRAADKSHVFIVHGHDELAKTETARFIERMGFKPIILHEQASSGKTVIEKIEEYSNVGFGVVLYTPCDVGSKASDSGGVRPRARQNVVFEHGYLIGKIGRHNVCALVKGNVETPTDISGVVYISMSGDWRVALAKELRNSGYAVDMNKVL